MGVRFRVVAYCNSQQQASAAENLIRQTLIRLEATFSDYRPDSEAMRLCYLPNDTRFPASDSMLDLLEKSIEVRNLTNGCFDITIGKLTQLWRQKRKLQSNQQAMAKLEQEFSNIAAQIRTRDSDTCFHLDWEHRVFQQVQSDYSLDFGGIAKGYAADQIISQLKHKLGIQHALVDASGDITATELPPNSKSAGWLIGLSEINPEQGLQTKLRIKNYSIASSGDARQFLVEGNDRKSHILDPRTGVPIPGNHLTIVANPKGYLADALASALSVCDEREFEMIVDRFPGTHATRFSKVAGQTRQLKSKQWDKWLNEHQANE